MYMPGKLGIVTADCIVCCINKMKSYLFLIATIMYASVYKELMFPVFYLKYDIFAE